MKYSIITCALILCMNSVQATEPSIEVKQLYQAAQENKTERMDTMLKWHEQLDKKKPAQMLEQAVMLAKEQNNAQAALLLNTRLKQEQVGVWERYFRGITLVATLGVFAGLGMAFKTGLAEKSGQKRSLDGVAAHLPNAHDVDPCLEAVSPSHPRYFSDHETEQMYICSAEENITPVVDFVPGNYTKSEVTERKRSL